MAKGFFPGFATVFTEGGAHKVMLPNGELIPHLVQTVTDDGVDTARVTMTFLVNVASTKEEALEKYKNK